MQIQSTKLKPIIEAYTSYHSEVFESEYPQEFWLHSASQQIQEKFDKEDLADPDKKDLESLFATIAKIEINDENFTDKHPTTNGNWWMGLQELIPKEPVIFEAFGALFQDNRPVKDRLREFEDHIGPILEEYGDQIDHLPNSFSPGKIQGISTTLLEIFYPDSFVAYKWKPMKEFFDKYMDYQVGTARNKPPADQYAELVTGFEKILVELQEVYPDADMCDVHGVIYSRKPLQKQVSKVVNISAPTDSIKIFPERPVQITNEDLEFATQKDPEDADGQVIAKFHDISSQLATLFSQDDQFADLIWESDELGSPYIGPDYTGYNSAEYLWIGLTHEHMREFGRPTKSLQMEFGVSADGKSDSGFFGRNALSGIYLNPRTGDSELKAQIGQNLKENSEVFAELLARDRYVLYLGENTLRSPSSEQIRRIADEVSNGMLVTADITFEDLRETQDVAKMVAEDFLALMPYYALLVGIDGFLIPTDISESKDPSTPIEKPANGEEYARHLSSSKQMIFHGPPGTGKTAQAHEFSRWWVNEHPEVDNPDTHIGHVTFHPAYSYEDFVEGITANVEEEGQGATEEQGSDIEYTIKDGPFKKLAQKASETYYKTKPGKEPPRYILIIDEINRGNVPELFGEAMTLLEPDKRLGGEHEMQVSLPHSGQDFTLPPNLYVIGTMNTADRSIALVDAALRRRFRFRHFPPDYEYLMDAYDFETRADLKEAVSSGTNIRSLVAQSILTLKVINERIRSNLDRGQQIGHSYLLPNENGRDTFEKPQDVVDAWRFEILPLLLEYYFGQYGRMKREVFDNVEVDIIDWEEAEIAEFDKNTLADELDRLR